MINKIAAKYLTGNKKKIFGNISWAVIGKVIDIVRALLIGVLIARYLKPENYGILNYAVGYIGMFTLFVEFGMTGILVREFSKKNTDKNQIFGTAIIMRTVLAVIAVLLVFGSVYFFEDSKMLRVFIMINSFNILFLSASETFKAFFRSQLKNEFIVKSEVFRSLFLVVIKVGLLIFEAPLYAFVLAASFDSLIILISFQYIFRKRFWSIAKFNFNFKLSKVLILSSLPLFFEGIASVLYQRIDVVMAGKFIDAEAVGFYSVATKFVSFAIFIPLIITQTLSPLLVRKLEDADGDITNKDYLKYRQKISDIVILSGLVISVFLFVAAKPVITILYGDDYLESIGILQVLAWKGLFCGVGYVGSAMIVTEGRQKYIYLRNIIGGSLNIGLNFLLIPQFGVIGIAYATIISFGIATYISNLFIPMYIVDFKTQTNSLIFGGFRMIKAGLDARKKSKK